MPLTPSRPFTRNDDDDNDNDDDDDDIIVVMFCCTVDMRPDICYNYNK